MSNKVASLAKAARRQNGRSEAAAIVNNTFQIKLSDLVIGDGRGITALQILDELIQHRMDVVVSLRMVKLIKAANKELMDYNAVRLGLLDQYGVPGKQSKRWGELEASLKKAEADVETENNPANERALTRLRREMKDLEDRTTFEDEESQAAFEAEHVKLVAVEIPLPGKKFRTEDFPHLSVANERQTDHGISPQDLLLIEWLFEE